MNTFQTLVNRGNAILKEWHSYEGLDDSSKRMLSELVATSLITLCGNEMKNWTQEELQDRVNMLRIAMTSAFQVGRSSIPKKIRRSI